MPLSVLANEIYAVLSQRVPAHDPRITYMELVQALPPLPVPFAGLHWRDPRLDEALSEIVQACRALGLPALSAIVVNGESRQPGAAYYPVAHPGVNDSMLREVQWANEYQNASQTVYPPHL